MINEHLKYDFEQNIDLGVSGVKYFAEKDELFKSGENYHVTLYSDGGDRASGRNTSNQRFSVEVRGVNHATSKHIIEKIAEYLQNTFAEDRYCMLEPVPNVSNRTYRNCRVLNISNLSNLGVDNENKIVFRIEATIYYNK